MSEWSLSFSSSAENDFRKLGSEDKERICQKTGWLVKNYDSITHLPLTGPWQGFFKLRVGDLRIIYKVEHGRSIIIVYAIGHRNKIYKRRK